MALNRWLIELREVILIFGFLLLVISYVKENFDPLGYYFVFGILVIIFASILYLIKFFNKFE